MIRQLKNKGENKMYCKTCGKELTKGASICTECGFMVGRGDKFCSHCGTSVLPGQSLCINCGFMLDNELFENKIIVEQDKENSKEATPEILREHELNCSEKAKSNKPHKYQKYVKNVKSIKIITLIVQSLSLLLILALIFLPIYNTSYSHTYSFDNLNKIIDTDDLEDFDSLLEISEYLRKETDLTDDELSELMLYGEVEIERNKNFSLWDDFSILLNGLKQIDNNPEMLIAYIYIGLFAIFEIIFAAILIITTITQIIKTSQEIHSIETTTMLSYNQMLKTGIGEKKEKVLKKQTVMNLVIYALFDVIYTKLFGVISGDELISEEIRYMIGISGISQSIFIIFAMLIGYVILNNMQKSKEKEMLVEISKEEING